MSEPIKVIASGWIPVSERLPSVPGRYVVWFQDDIAVLPVDCGWRWGDWSTMRDDIAKTITHWSDWVGPHVAATGSRGV